MPLKYRLTVYECAVDLIDNQVPPQSHVYLLTQAEEKVIEGYIQQALAQGYILPSFSFLLRTSVVVSHV